MAAKGMTRATIFALLVAASCTNSSPSPSSSSTEISATTASPTTSSPTPSSQAVVDGASLPGGCEGGEPSAAESIAFVGDGRAWALDPDQGTLSCMFVTRDALPFFWGPQGDRLITDRSRIRRLDGSHPLDLPLPPAPVYDWGHPIGTAVVYAGEQSPRRPGKLFLDGGNTEVLNGLPFATYDDIAYHPSGTALAMALRASDGQPEIYLSTNEGKDKRLLVVGVSATRFTSVRFSPNGKEIYYLAEHKGGYTQLHQLRLPEARNPIDLWKSEAGVTAHGLQLSDDGRSIAFDTGSSCRDETAMLASGTSAEPSLPSVDGPTHALGFLDAGRELVSSGGCGAPLDLWTVSAGEAPVLVATGVDLAASRAVGPETGAPLPDGSLTGKIPPAG